MSSFYWQPTLQKGALFDYSDRKTLVENTLHKDSLVNFDVYPISGATVDCAKKYGANIIVRGLCNDGTFEDFKMDVNNLA